MANTLEQSDARPKPAAWGLLGTLLWGALIALGFIVVQVAAAFTHVKANNPSASAEELLKLLEAAAGTGSILSIATVASTIVGCSLTAGAIKLKKGSVLGEYLCLRAVSARALLKWLGYVAVFIAVTDLFTVMIGRPVVAPFMRDIYATANPLWLLLLALIVAAPLFEEVFFRGFLFAGLQSSFLGSTGAILTTAVVWALIHIQYDAYGMVIVVLLGLLLGWARLASGSLYVPMSMHALSNLVATLETALLS